MTEILLNTILSTNDAMYICIDISNIYLTERLITCTCPWPWYLKSLPMHIIYTTRNWMVKYKCKLKKACLPQVGILPTSYYISALLHTTGLWDMSLTPSNLPWWLMILASSMLDMSMLHILARHHEKILTSVWIEQGIYCGIGTVLFWHINAQLCVQATQKILAPKTKQTSRLSPFNQHQKHLARFCKNQCHPIPPHPWKWNQIHQAICS